MVQSQNLLQTRNKNYETKASEKGKSIGEISNPLMIEKHAETYAQDVERCLQENLSQS